MAVKLMFNLSWYSRNSQEVLHRKVGEQGTVKVDEAKHPLRSMR